MQIRRFYTLNDGVYKVSIKTEKWSELDQQLMAKYGEPEIDLGGSFTGPPAFTLSSNLVKIMSESPFTQSFDSQDYADAEDRADVWATEISARIDAAVTDLRTNTDDFTREEVETV
jgi:hypothetical protein